MTKKDPKISTMQHIYSLPTYPDWNNSEGFWRNFKKMNLVKQQMCQNILDGDLHKWERGWESISEKDIENQAIKQKRYLLISEKTKSYLEGKSNHNILHDSVGKGIYIVITV